MPGMTKICHLKEAFIARISRMSSGYDEVRIHFDHYIKGSLKSKTKGKRATSAPSYEVHDEMNIRTISLKNLLSSSKTKKSLCDLQAQAQLEHFEGYLKQVVVAHDMMVNTNCPHTIQEDFKVCGHEEADTLIPLHVLDSLHENKFRKIHVRSPNKMYNLSS